VADLAGGAAVALSLDPVEVAEVGVLLSHRYASDPDALVAEVSP